MPTQAEKAELTLASEMRKWATEYHEGLGKGHRVATEEIWCVGCKLNRAAKTLDALTTKSAEREHRIEEAVKLINEGMENEVCECAGCKKRRVNLQNLLDLLTKPADGEDA